MSAPDPFEDPPRQVGDGEMLNVDVGAYEGPLDLLLALARQNKVDLAKIKMLPLAEQYLAFIAEAKELRIELAADFLVMAAWLAWLKSRLIAPDDGTDDCPSGEELAEDLAFRLQRLEAMRQAADALMRRPQLGQDVFPRGMPEVTKVSREVTFTASLFDLLNAYGTVRQGEIVRTMTMEKRPVFSLVDARAVLERMIGPNADWMPLDTLLAAMPAGEARRAVTASTFGAILEMAREGKVSVRQSGAFAPLFIRSGESRGEGEKGG